MATTIEVLNSKGGAGECTVSIILAYALHPAGHSTLLIDTHLQGSASDWHDATDDNAFGVGFHGNSGGLEGITCQVFTPFTRVMTEAWD